MKSVDGNARHPQRIVILGGGTAGWIAANSIAHAWSDRNLDITLVESPTIGTVGVGEGSTPRLKIFFDSIGVAESEWMPRCNATYKNGISFLNWSSRPGFERYFHPFASQLDQHTLTAFYYNTYARRRGIDVHAHPDRYFLTAALSNNRQGPIPGENFPFVVEYGYHFDANLVGEFLRDKATQRGVKHVEARVVDVRQADDGSIDSLLTEGDEIIGGDFFIDCSGFRGAIIQKTLQVPFRTYAENLFNDSAVVLPTDSPQEIGSQTVSTALSCGWAWEIPLTNRVGNGYVYSSNYCSPDRAESELREHLGLQDGEVEARHLRMRVGRVDEHWAKNCLAVGLSQGFIEPLEATALNLVCSSVQDFIETVDMNGVAGDGRSAYNARCNERFESIRDYIVAHYIMNSREDTDYWQDCAGVTEISDTLRQILQIWKEGKSLSQEMERLDLRSSYTAMSWHCLLAGYGFFPELRHSAGDQAATRHVDMAEIDDFVRRSALNFKSQNELLQALAA